MKLPLFIKRPPSPTKLFGMDGALDKASVVIIPVPWEVTVSSRSRTSLGPESILKASYNLGNMSHRSWSIQDFGVGMLPIPYEWKARSNQLRNHTIGHIRAMELGFKKPSIKKSLVKKIDHEAWQLKEEVKAKALTYLKEDRLVGILGGEHSVALGLVEALAEFHNNFGVLQIDAHPDLYKTYHGFQYSHASIMHNVLQLPHIPRLVQVGLRSCATEELQVMAAEEGRIFPFFDEDLKLQQLQGVTWKRIGDTLVEILPERVYISLDIDGLDAKLCPSTGAPVPGGLGLDEIYYLLEQIVKAGKTIVGFDLCEVAPGENNNWDAQVGSHLLYKLVMMLGASQGKASF